ncbi:putative 60S ribosomal protein L19 [Burkholderia pseudomallei]|nr:putative 60S ribosomal protein L19 [Burkholderia pseudomallei]CAJ5551552.1 putative 60S ribosomal protein L19 [Burkholderia pseudomallei]CAJ7326939.1 putative 60S ribosomal protein L19 [Burkholderia pseudomallei]CAJ7978972.1 putative 60S ribosomal protein L19 [Burkholderia pseudomallei]CAJ9300631.1 putative 60S ribosomal protein L19 [Burkholderia pseudomallei]
MRRGARAADAIRLFALHSRKGAGDTQGNSSCRRTSGGAAGEARRRPLKPACARLCALTSARAGDAARLLPPAPVRRLSPRSAACDPRKRHADARRAACRPGAAALMRRLLATRHSPLATRHSPSAKRHSPSAKRQAPSAKRQAPSAKRQAPSAKRQAPSAKRQAPIGHRSSSSVPSGGRAPLPRRRARAGCRRRNDPAGHCAMGAPQRASRRSPACGYYQIW